MPRKGYTPEQIIGKLREVDVLVQQGHAVREAVRRIGVSDHTYYVWRREYGGMGVEQAKVEAQGVGEGERSAEETGGRPELGQGHP